MELGLYTFGDITTDPRTGLTLTPQQRYAEILAAAKLADEAGLDVFGIGEHHRLDIPLSRQAPIAPRPLTKLPIWLGVGGTPASAQRAGDLGLPLCLANIFQPPASFRGQVEDYRRRHAADAGHDPRACRVAVATHVHVAKDSQAARDDFYPHYSAYFRDHAPRADLAIETPRDVYEKRASPTGPIFVGSPQQIIDKLLYERELFGVDRFLAQLDLGGLPYAKVARAIELLATEVLPALRAA